MKFAEVECKKCGNPYKIRVDEMNTKCCPHCGIYGYVKVIKTDYNENNGETK